MFLRPSEAAKQLGISKSSLRTYAREGKIEHIYTTGGHRRYKIEGFCGEKHVFNTHAFKEKKFQEELQKAKKTTTGAIYCRVSSSKQKDDLERQIQTLQTQFPDYEVFQDICSGLNYKRKGLSRLLEQVQAKTITTVVVAHKDRLARFGSEIIEWIINQAGASLFILDRTEHSKEQELTEDLMAIVHVFSCRFNGKRRYKESSDQSRKKRKKTDSQ